MPEIHQAFSFLPLPLSTASTTLPPYQYQDMDYLTCQHVRLQKKIICYDDRLDKTKICASNFFLFQIIETQLLNQ